MAGQFKFGTVTYGSTGIKTITCGWQPLGAEFFVEPGPGSTYTTIERSVGVTDGTNQSCTQEYTDPSRSRMERFTDRLADIRKWNSGTSVYDQKFMTALDSFTATEVKHNVTVFDTTYQLRYKIWG